MVCTCCKVGKPMALFDVWKEKNSTAMTHEPLAACVTSGSRSGGHWHAVVDATSYAMSVTVNKPPERPTQLANNMLGTVRTI